MFLFHSIMIYKCFRLCSPQMVRVVFISSFYSQDCFDRNVLLFNSGVFVSECSVGVNCP